jgi:hypothetical protein
MRFPGTVLLVRGFVVGFVFALGTGCGGNASSAGSLMRGDGSGTHEGGAFPEVDASMTRDASVPPRVPVANPKEGGVDEVSHDAAEPSDAPGPTRAPDAMGLPDGTAPTDAAQGARDAGCPIGPTDVTPFPSLSGTADVMGTLGTSDPNGGLCTPLTPTASAGRLAFSLDATGCSLDYVAAGAEYKSEARQSTQAAEMSSNPVTFDGDRYRCAFEWNSPTWFMDQLSAVCPELNGSFNGVLASLIFTIERSTHAVSLSRQCLHQGNSCTSTGTYLENSDSLSLTGSLSTCVPVP